MATGLSFAAVRGAVAQSVDGKSNPQYDADVQLRQEAATRDAARRQELTASILAAREVATGRKFAAALRGSLTDSLARLDLASLEAFANAGGLGDIEAAVRASIVPSVLGDTAKDLAFSPVPPCRVVDTRFAVGGILAASSTRSFLVRNAGGFAVQGGSATDCGIPATATAVEMNFVAVGATGPGDLRAYAFGGTLPGSSVINYASVSGLNIANGIAQPVCDPAGATPCTNDISVLTEASNTHLIIDVVGYFNKIDKSQVKSFIVTTAPGAATYTNTCSNVGGYQVTVVAPVAGKIVARMAGSYSINHVTGTTSVLIMTLGSTATDCGNGEQFIRVEASSPTAGLSVFPVSLSRVINVAAGSSTTVFLNGLITFGGSGHALQGAADNLLEATFIPN